MKFVLTINQAGAVLAGLSEKLDIIDLALFDAFKDFANGNKCEKKIEGKRVWFWISYQALIKEIPMVPLKTKDAVYRRMKRLADADVIEFHPRNKQTGKTFFAWATNYDNLVSRDFTEEELKMLNPTYGYKSVGGTDEKPEGYGYKSVGGTDEKPYNQYTKDQGTNQGTNNHSSPNAKKASGDTPPKTPWTKEVSSLFDKINEEAHRAANLEYGPFNWAAGDGRQFAALKKIRDAMIPDIERKLHHAPDEKEIQSGFEYLFRYGFEFFKKVADDKGGAINFTPSAILNSYNLILSHARASHTTRKSKQEQRIDDQHEARAAFYRDLVSDLVETGDGGG